MRRPCARRRWSRTAEMYVDNMTLFSQRPKEPLFCQRPNFRMVVIGPELAAGYPVRRGVPSGCVQLVRRLLDVRVLP